jgi:hypothetical protein
MELETAQELVILAAALAVGVILAVVDPERMPARSPGRSVSGGFGSLSGWS